MLFSLAIILLLGLCAGALFARLRLPALMGMLLAGIAIGPHALNLIDDSLLAISADIRRIALIVILMRAGLSYALAAGPSAALLILCVLLFRMAGVCLCLLKTPLTRRERLFCMIAFLPKATVQAAIGGLPLAMGLSCGEIVLTVAVLSILITAPLGALLIDITYPRLLTLSDVVPGGRD